MPLTDYDAQLERIGNSVNPDYDGPTNYDGRLEQIALGIGSVIDNVGDLNTAVAVNTKDIENLKKLAEGVLYDYSTDTDEKYVKTVPSGAMPYASLDKLGGKTLVWNQLADFGTLVWESGSRQYAFTQGTPIYAGHKYYFCGTITSETDVDIRIYTRKDDTNKIEGRVYRDTPATIFTATNDGVSTGTNSSVNGNIWLYMNVSSGDSATNIMLTDLTLLYGSGNEPSTVAEFQQTFPADYYAYNAGTLLSAGVTSVVSKDSNNTTLQTYSIPAEIQALEGYGWSAGTAYNYVDFERKVFVKNVGSRAYASGDESDSTVVTDMTTTYYPLNPAIETDISAYLIDDNMISVESGGSLTFPNSNGSDYLIPVPSQETYMIDLSA